MGIYPVPSPWGGVPVWCQVWWGVPLSSPKSGVGGGILVQSQIRDPPPVNRQTENSVGGNNGFSSTDRPNVVETKLTKSTHLLLLISNNLKRNYENLTSVDRINLLPDSGSE